QREHLLARRDGTAGADGRAGTAGGAQRGGGGRGDAAREAHFALRDVVDQLVRTVEHVEGYDRSLTDILNAHLAQVSVRQNEDMRRISGWAAILGAETLIAGVYGMNFEHMPELSWRFGYAGCLLVMLVVGTVLHRRFRRAGWL
ncbi:CorA family divalent cation transporter, partial [Kineococcus glutinatus]|uniref:CorA family divalent cation transporter n=1 Tax=Kineococcus glutinatus TaxID=1070872 RepID=UPI0031EC74E9